LRYDAIVIGGGHNGLTAAAYLAKAGLKVLVAERRAVLGGAAATEAVWPGFRVDTGSWDGGLFLPQIVRDLALEEHGLRFIESESLVHVLQPGGRGLTLWRDAQRTARELGATSGENASRYPAFVAQLTRLAGVLRPILTLAPPPLKGDQPGDLLPWLPVALRAKRLGRRDMMELLRVLPMPAWDWLGEWFGERGSPESEALKAALGAIGTLGSLQGPRASGTAFLMLYYALGAEHGAPRAVRFIRGGAGSLSDALAGAARLHGAEVCPAFPVQRIILEDGRAAGVALEDGRRFTARAVLSSTDPRTTFFGLVGAPHLEVRLVREVKNIRFRGSLARVNLALSGLPQFRIPAGEIERLGGRILICPDLETLERAYDDAKYGRFSARPCLDMALPTLRDPSLAPPGQHLLLVNVQYAPYHLATGTWDEHRERLGDRVVDILDEWIPGLRELILHRQVLTPLDLEREYGLPEGCIYQGQMGLDQLLFMRPVAGARGSQTAIENLYLCGAGAHPGGGLTGAPGYNAARQVIKDLLQK
jgi:phytoene dehydrogenase-like protein